MKFLMGSVLTKWSAGSRGDQVRSLMLGGLRVLKETRRVAIRAERGCRNTANVNVSDRTSRLYTVPK